MIKINGSKLKEKIFQGVVRLLLLLSKLCLRNAKVRRFAFKKVRERLAHRLIVNRGSKQAEDKYYMGKAALRSLERTMEGNISSKYFKALVEYTLGGILWGGKIGPKRKFYEEKGFYPPSFVLICPTQACNLDCPGCYTASGKGKWGNTLKYEVVDRVVREMKELWRAHVVVFSGGEPLLYPHLFDVARKHGDVLFLIYTNGTLINEKMAQRLAEVGNITPAISVEGFEGETDARRGKGVYRKILTAFANLREAGVPFGISVTATRENVDAVTSDKFYDFYFEEQGAKYQWQFHYMPIGKSYTLALMPTPEQRLFMRERKRKMEREKEYFIGDFWNDSTVVCGCIAAGRRGSERWCGGHFNITGAGDCTPCGFQPYAADNINEVYERGGDLNTVLESDFFRAIREWQTSYGYGKPDGEQNNLLMTCPIRDHYQVYYEQILQKYHPRPIYDEAQAAMEDEEYRKGLINYGKELRRLSRPIWEKEYLSKK